MLDKNFIKKMINNALKQYYADNAILNEQDYDYLYQKIIKSQKEAPQALIHDLVQDAVYGYITDSPYF